MRYIPADIATYCLAGIIFLGAFSRFTGGRYTPWFHDYQEYHKPNDGTPTAAIIPVMDLFLGFLILLRRTRFIAVIVAEAFMVVGMILQMNAGKSFAIDAMMVVIATLGIVKSR